MRVFAYTLAVVGLTLVSQAASADDVQRLPAVDIEHRYLLTAGYDDAPADLASDYVSRVAGHAANRTALTNTASTGIAAQDTKDGAAAAQGTLKADSCDENQCCDHGDSCDCCDCCEPIWVHRTGIWAEYIYLRARDGEVAFGQPIDGPIFNPALPPVQIGPTAVADPQYDSSFRAGVNWAMDDCTSIAFEYTHFESNVDAAAAIGAPDVIRSLVTHPTTVNAASDVLSAFAANSIDFDNVDLDFRRLWDGDDCYAINYLIGVRYTRMDQNFRSSFINAGTTNVDTDIAFDGGGLRLGLEGERFPFEGGFLVYGKTAANFVAGEFRARYTQTDTFTGTLVDTSWEAGRMISQLELELGVGWESHCRHWRLTLGYEMSAWYNVVKTDEYIQAVQRNNFLDLGDAMTFDGFVGRVQYNF